MQYTGSGQDGNLNISDCTDFGDSESSNKYRVKKKGQTEKKGNGTQIDSDSDEEENQDLESSIPTTATSKVKNAKLDSDLETEEISHHSLVQEGNISGAKRSMTSGSSRYVLLDSDSENEDIGVRAQENKYRSKRVLSGSDSDHDDTLHCKKSRAIYSDDDTNKVGTELQHFDEEVNHSISVQKYKRRIIVSDEEDD